MNKTNDLGFNFLAMSQQRSKNAFVNTLSVGLLSLASLAAFVYIKSRKKRGVNRWEDESKTSSEFDGATVKTKSSSSNVESTWMGATDSHTSTKMDLLHRGHNKGGKLLVVLVGMPGSYKTLIARKVARFLRWNSFETRAFSIARYRLDRLGRKSADFFDPKNKGGNKQRKAVLNEAIEDALRFLRRGGEIAILDGTNTTKERRHMIRQRLQKEDDGRFCEIMWIETLCGDDALGIEKLAALEEGSPDFLGVDDYKRRCAFYKQGYSNVAESEGPFLRIYPQFEKFTLHKTQGYLPTKIVSFVVNLRPNANQKSVVFCRHGESTFNAKCPPQLGGNSDLTGRGLKFSKGLAEFLETQGDDICVWASTMRRSRETAAAISTAKRKVQWRALNDLDVGVADGLSYEQVRARFPEEYRARSADKLRYRYPRGESYLDLIARLEPVIFEMERWNSADGQLVIIAHQAVLRCIRAWCLDLQLEEIPFLDVPLHTLIRLEATTYGCREKRIRIVVDEEGPSIFRNV